MRKLFLFIAASAMLFACEKEVVVENGDYLNEDANIAFFGSDTEYQEELQLSLERTFKERTDWEQEVGIILIGTRAEDLYRKYFIF